MLEFPNCKINLGLQVIAKRPDGYHNLATIFYPIAWKDALEITPIDAYHEATRSAHMHHQQIDALHLYTSGLPVAGDPANNLCVKAWQLLRKDFPTLPPVQIFLHKAIPSGAGLGGGSADGAFMLRMLNEQFQLQLTQQQLLAYALQLGSDCPFFILNTPAYATGRGEVLTPISIPQLEHCKWYIINPGIHIPTGWAFAQLQPKPTDIELTKAIEAPITTWRDSIVNDFQAAVAKHYPQIQQIIDQLYEHGALYAAMSGSGSTVYGIYPQGATPPTLSLADSYLQQWID
ncbi:MAG: 4-(cytidine 5'-diphospho)-2-C-methyl-D-erythritol kinase [Chitinophagaceae bacterium]